MCAQGAISFEKSPYYLSSTVAAMELHQLLPAAKLIALLRDPKARAYSSFHHHCRNRRIVVVPRRGRGGEAKGAGSWETLHVVFNGDCATVEHCCCAPHDLRPSGRNHGFSNRRFKRPRGLGDKLEAAAADAWARSGPRQLWLQARTFAVGGKERHGSDDEGEADIGSSRSDRREREGTALAPEVCDAAAFEAYLASTSVDPDAANLGTVLRKGLYAKQLSTYLGLFGRQQLLVLDGATFAQDPHATLRRVFAFAGLPDHAYGDAVAQNAQGYWYVVGRASKGNKPRLAYGAMQPASLARLAAFYAEPDEALRALFPEERFSWLPPRPPDVSLPDLPLSGAPRPAAMPNRRTEDGGEDEGQQSWMDQGRRKKR